MLIDKYITQESVSEHTSQQKTDCENEELTKL